MPRQDTMLVAALLAVCALVIWGSLGLRPGSFEPLGPGAFPLALAGGIAVLSLVLLGQSVARSRNAPAQDAEPRDPGRRPGLAAALMVLATGFGLTIAYLRIDFAIVAFVFLAASMSVLARFRLRELPLILVVAAITAFGTDYLFTQVLIINLP